MGAMKDKAIELHNMTSHELCERVVGFCEQVAKALAGLSTDGRTVDDEAAEAVWAAHELQARHGSPAVSHVHPDAKRAAEAASHINGYSATVALLRAASTIDEMDQRIKGFEMMETLRNFAAKPTRAELLKERDALKAEVEAKDKRIKELTVEASREKAWRAAADGTVRVQGDLIRALRDVNADLDRQRCEGETEAEKSARRIPPGPRPRRGEEEAS